MLVREKNKFRKSRKRIATSKKCDELIILLSKEIESILVAYTDEECSNFTDKGECTFKSELVALEEQIKFEKKALGDSYENSYKVYMRLLDIKAYVWTLKRKYFRRSS